GVHDPAEADERVPGGAHRTVLTRGVHSCRSTFLRGEVGRRPTSEIELGVPSVVSAGDSVVVLRPDDPRTVHQHRAERLVTGLEGFPRQLDAATYVLHFGLG